MENKLVLPLICAIIIAFAYCAAFHNERDKNQVLKEKIVKLEKTVNHD
jgi:hypothetical protein